MAVIYVTAALFVIFSHISHVPAAFMEIWDGAFSARGVQGGVVGALIVGFRRAAFSNEARSEEHTSELQSLMRISYAVSCLKKKNDTLCSRVLWLSLFRYH